MKIAKSRRKAKQSAQKPISNPQPNKPRKEIVETLRNLIEAAKAEGDDSTFLAVLMPATILTSQTHDLEDMLAEGMLGKGVIGEDTLGLLSPKEILKLHIVEMIYSDEAMPQSVLESVYLILRQRLKLGDDKGELLAKVLKEIFFPPEELKEILSAEMDEEDKAEPPVRRRRSRYLHLR